MSTQAMTLDELYAEFDELGDWDAQCDYLIDLGHELPKLPAEAKIEANRVHGCQSNVWLVAQVSTTAPRRVEFQANSDAIIVNGLIAVLQIMYGGHTAAEILALDARQVFERLGLQHQLSPQRRNGLFGMVERIREIARQAV
jgi:cysteine desulfuration protein SufE